MSGYYTPRRTKNLYTPGLSAPFKISRSKIELFMQCRRCFYMDRRLGVARPSSPPYTLNSAVDTLLKKEFDLLRKERTPHPLMEKYGINAVPVMHDALDEWRNNFKGVRYLHAPTNLLIFGAIDDLWQTPQDEYVVVDYKSTSKNETITALDKGWQDAYKRQMEIYQWLLRRNGLTVSDTGYFVYCNGRTDAPRFEGKLDFHITMIPYKGDDGWVEETVQSAYACLNSTTIPPAGEECDFCAYRNAAREVSSF